MPPNQVPVQATPPKRQRTLFAFFQKQTTPQPVTSSPHPNKENDVSSNPPISSPTSFAIPPGKRNPHPPLLSSPSLNRQMGHLKTVSSNGMSSPSPSVRSVQSVQSVASTVRESEEDEMIVAPRKKTQKRSCISDEEDEIASQSKSLQLASFSYQDSSQSKSTSSLSKLSISSVKKTEKDDETENDQQRYHWLIHIRDASGHDASHPDYNPQTLYIPPSAWSHFTPFEQQFWSLKQHHFDCVMFFKKGKFYELYDLDAELGHRLFDLKLTRRVNMSMVGVPESSFGYWAMKWLGAGYRVARVDQMDTMVTKRLKDKENKEKSSSKLIQRELTAILTPGTLTDPSFISTPQATYCMALYEESKSLKVMLIESSTAQCFYGQVDHLSHFTSLFYQWKPRELIVQQALSPSLLQVLKNALFSCQIIKVNACNDQIYQQSLQQYNIKVPHDDTALFSRECLNAFFVYFKRLCIADTLFPCLEFHSTCSALHSSIYMKVDHQTMQMIQWDCLFQLLSRHVQTAVGQRLVQQWIWMPLQRANDILERQEALTELKEKRMAIPKVLCDYDVERWFIRARQGAMTLKQFMSLLEAFHALKEWIQSLRQEHFESALLMSLIEACPCLIQPLNEFETSFIIENNEFIPQDNIFKQCELERQEVERSLQDYLKEQQKRYQIDIRYRDIQQNIYQLECPRSFQAPSHWQRQSQTQQVTRYYTAELKKMIESLEEKKAQTQLMKEQSMKRLLQEHLAKNEYKEALYFLAQWDALQSLSRVEFSVENQCLPRLLEDNGTSCFECKGLVHPWLKTKGPFIENDITLTTSRVLLLTGGNMSGKSTLMRQVAICILLAQMGCCVPCRECEWRPFDACYTRMGAGDDLLKSTFTQELEETSLVLKEATCRSFLFLDELGRGTSTLEGSVLAASVLYHVAQRYQCCCLFATHYPLLAELLSEHDDRILSMHLATQTHQGQLIFLYRLVPGVQPSYGHEVARLAGLNNGLVQRAKEWSRLYAETQRQAHMKELKMCLKLADLALKVSRKRVV